MLIIKNVNNKNIIILNDFVLFFKKYNCVKNIINPIIQHIIEMHIKNIII